ncbi:hypothetical protein V8E36_007134 [Tilletia maclaganii]
MKNSKIDTTGLPHHRILGQILYELICRESSGDGVRIASLRRQLAADDVVANAYPHNLSKAISNSLRRLLWDGKIIREARGFYQVAPVSADGTPPSTAKQSSSAGGSSSAASGSRKPKQKARRPDDDDDDPTADDDGRSGSRKKPRLSANNTANANLASGSNVASGSNIHLPPIHHLTDPRLSLAPPPPPPLPHHPYQYPPYHPHPHPGLDAQLQPPQFQPHYAYYQPNPYAPPPPPPPPQQFYHHQFPLGRSSFGTSWEREPPRFYTSGLPSHSPIPAAPTRQPQQQQQQQSSGRPGPFYAAHQVNQEISAFLPDIPSPVAGATSSTGPGTATAAAGGGGAAGSTTSAGSASGSGTGLLGGSSSSSGSNSVGKTPMLGSFLPPPGRQNYLNPMRSDTVYPGLSAPLASSSSASAAATRPLFTSMPSSSSRESGHYQPVSSTRADLDAISASASSTNGAATAAAANGATATADSTKPLSIASLLSSRPASPSETMRQHFAKRCPTLAKLVVEALQVLPSPQSHAVPAPAVRQWVYDRLSVSNSPVEADRQAKVTRAADLMLASLVYTGVAQESGSDEMGEPMFTLK